MVLEAETVAKNRTKPQGESFIFLFLSKNGIYDVFYLFSYILIKIESLTNSHKVWVAFGFWGIPAHLSSITDSGIFQIFKVNFDCLCLI